MGIMLLRLVAKLLAGAALRPPPHDPPALDWGCCSCPLLLCRRMKLLFVMSLLINHLPLSRMLSLKLPANGAGADGDICNRTIVQPPGAIA